MKIDSRLSVAELSVERGQRNILERISVQFASGGVTAVLGPNGAGKSTLLSCMAGLLQASHGVVDLDGMPLAALPPDERARRIAFLPQIPEISWPVDVATLVALGRIPFRRLASDADNEAAVRRAMQATRTAQWSQRVVTTLSEANARACCWRACWPANPTGFWPTSRSPASIRRISSRPRTCCARSRRRATASC